MQLPPTGHVQLFLPCSVGSLLGCLLFVMGLVTAPVQEARAAANAPVSELLLTGTALAATPESVSFSFGLRVKGVVPLRDQLRDGAQMLLEGTVRLLQSNAIRPNSELASFPVLWTVRHDPLTREFVLIDVDNTTRRGPFLDVLLRDMWHSIRAELLPAEPLETDQTYIVRLSMVLKYAEVPPWLRKALFFWSWELSPVLRHEQRFKLTDFPGLS